MTVKRRKGLALVFTGALLVLSGFIYAGGSASPDSQPLKSSVSIDASFRQEDGTSLRESTVRFSTDESSAEYSLDAGSALAVSGLPRNGKLTMTVLGPQNQVRAAMELTFSEGAVIDAATDGSGAGHITLKRDTDEVALAFLLKSDGSILCALRLEPSDTGTR